MAFELWWVTAGANAIMVAVYAAISITILTGIARGNQWTTNPIAVATGAIFVTCTVGHGIHRGHSAEHVEIAECDQVGDAHDGTEQHDPVGNVHEKIPVNRVSRRTTSTNHPKTNR